MTATCDIPTPPLTFTCILESLLRQYLSLVNDEVRKAAQGRLDGCLVDTAARAACYSLVRVRAGALAGSEFGLRTCGACESVPVRSNNVSVCVDFGRTEASASDELAYYVQAQAEAAEARAEAEALLEQRAALQKQKFTNLQP